MPLISLVQFLLPWDGRPVCCKYYPEAAPALPLNREADFLYSFFHRPSSARYSFFRSPEAFWMKGRARQIQRERTHSSSCIRTMCAGPSWSLNHTSPSASPSLQKGTMSVCWGCCNEIETGKLKQQKYIFS